MHTYEEDESKGWRDFWASNPDQENSKTQASLPGIKVLLSENVPEDTIVVGKKLFKVLSEEVT